MRKTILITGSTDGIGLATAKRLVEDGHHVLIHGRNEAKLKDAEKVISSASGDNRVEGYLADLSRMADVTALAEAITRKHETLDVLINNAGVFATPNTVTQSGLDVRFAVNTIAPYLLTQKLLPLLGTKARVINLSSAAQSPVDLKALSGHGQPLNDNAAYAQSKLALTMWSRRLAESLKENGPIIVAVNPGSLLATKMVKEAYGMAGSDISIGADVLVHAALDDDFAAASGQYFDNDKGKFASPHRDALDDKKSNEIVQAIEAILTTAK